MELNYFILSKKPIVPLYVRGERVSMWVSFSNKDENKYIAITCIDGEFRKSSSMEFFEFKYSSVIPFIYVLQDMILANIDKRLLAWMLKEGI